MSVFEIIWSVDALASLVVLYFFFEGLGDGTVSRRNARLWMVVISAIACIMCGSILFKIHGWDIPAFALLLAMVLPAVCFVAYMLIAFCNKGPWH
jgi:hypothetical protein